jgi:hypothetical protein
LFKVQVICFPKVEGDEKKLPAPRSFQRPHWFPWRRARQLGGQSLRAIHDKVEEMLQGKHKVLYLDIHSGK